MSITTVAREAGVSHTTVSRVINNHPAVSPETARQVREAMRRLGYVPPVKRRGPRSRARRGIHTRTVALLVSNTRKDDSGVPVIATLLEHVERSLTEAGMSLIFGRISDDQPIPVPLRERLVDGLLMYGKPVRPAVARRLEGFPCVWMLTRRSDLPSHSDCVQPDNYAAGRLAVEYLRGRGHRQLAVVSSRPTDPVIRQRVEGFLETAGYQALPARTFTEARDSESIVPGQGYEFDLEPIRERVAQLLGARPLPTGLFVPNAELAALAYRVLSEHGVQVGRDVEIICCNRNPLLLGLDPVPAVLDIRPDLIGRRAAEQLLWRMAHPQDASRVQVSITPQLLTPEELVEGASSS